MTKVLSNLQPGDIVKGLQDYLATSQYSVFIQSYNSTSTYDTLYDLFLLDEKRFITLCHSFYANQIFEVY